MAHLLLNKECSAKNKKLKQKGVSKMKEEKKLSLESIKVQSFVTALSSELSEKEQEKIYGGTDRVWMCQPNYITNQSFDKNKECLLIEG